MSSKRVPEIVYTLFRKKDESHGDPEANTEAHHHGVPQTIGMHIMSGFVEGLFSKENAYGLRTNGLACLARAFVQIVRSVGCTGPPLAYFENMYPSF